MKTIAKVMTPKRVAKVVRVDDIFGGVEYRIWDGKRHRDWHIYHMPNDAVKALLQLAASDYMMNDMFNQA